MRSKLRTVLVIPTNEHLSGFNLPNFVQEAFKQLHSDVELTAGLTIGMYQLSFRVDFAQRNV